MFFLKMIDNVQSVFAKTHERTLIKQTSKYVVNIVVNSIRAPVYSVRQSYLSEFITLTFQRSELAKQTSEVTSIMN